MTDFNILVVEDDHSVLHLIMTTLKMHAYHYTTASCGKEAIASAVSTHPDLILLDLGLPDIDGIEVIHTVREWSEVPIIVISARGEDSDKIKALDSGADDYLTKPFSVDELLARIRVTQRRLSYQVRKGEEDSVFENGELVIDYAANQVRVGNENIHLTPIEYKLLVLLSRHVGKVLTHSFMINEIWGTGIDTDIVSLRVYMAALRKKLGGQQPYIETHVGIGYSMNRF